MDFQVYTKSRTRLVIIYSFTTKTVFGGYLQEGFVRKSVRYASFTRARFSPFLKVVRCEFLRDFDFCRARTLEEGGRLKRR